MSVAAGRAGPAVDEATLANGIPVYVVPRVGAVGAVVCCLATGSRFDGARRAGIAHLLEHLMLRGSTGGSALPRRIHELGGRLQASTSKEELLVYARVPAEALADAIEIMAEEVGRGRLPVAGFEAERQVVLTELQGAADDPADAVQDAAFEAVFGSHPLAIPPGGRPETVEALTAADVESYRAERVHAGTIAVGVCGSTDAENVCGLLERTSLADVGPGPWSPVAAMAEPGGWSPVPRPAPTGGYAYVALTCDGFAYGDARAVAADVVTTLVCGSPTSTLYEELRERRGLAYALDGWHRPFRDTGILRVLVGTTGESAEEVAAVALDTLAEQLERGWTAAEVDRGRRQTWGDLVLDLESSEDAAAHLLRQRFVGGLDGWTHDAYRDALDDLTADDVNELARAWLGSGVQTVAAGPARSA